MDEYREEAPPVSRPAAIQARSKSLGGKGRGPAPRFCAHVASDPDPAAFARGYQSDRHGEGCRHLSARSAASRVAIFGAWARGSALRRPASDATEIVRCATGSSARRDGLCVASRRLCALDDTAGDGGGQTPRRRGARRSRNRSPSSWKPRAEAVAGKKCGASRSWTTSTSKRWRTS